jgi:hypothetical protein
MVPGDFEWSAKRVAKHLGKDPSKVKIAIAWPEPYVMSPELALRLRLYKEAKRRREEWVEKCAAQERRAAAKKQALEAKLRSLEVRKLRKANAWSAERQRGSRVNWFSLVPDDVAEAQVSWERLRNAHRMRVSGLKFREIGAAFGVSVTYASQMVARAERRSKWLSPVESYCREKDTDPSLNWYAARGVIPAKRWDRDWLHVS